MANNMSSYHQKTKNPLTGKWEDAEWLDNFFGQRRYGVRFKDGKVYNPSEIILQTK
jgi:hypothetical protein